MAYLISPTFVADGTTGDQQLVVDTVDGAFKVVGVLREGKALDPTDPTWSTIVNSDQSVAPYNQITNQSGQSVTTADDDLKFKYYEDQSKKETNVEKSPQLTGSSEAYSSGIVANSSVSGREQLYNVNPQQFASPANAKYKDREVRTLAYPIDIDPKQDHLKITKFKYERGGNVNLSGPGDSFTGKYEGTVILPMPKVSDSNGAEWGDSDLNVFGVAVASAYSGIANGLRDPKDAFSKFQNLLGDPSSALTNIGNSFTANLPGAAEIMGSIIASNAAKSINITVNPDELLARSTGKIANPNAELLFQGPVLRDFGFSFLMVARSKEEGKQIRNIIKWFKQGAAPKYLDNSALLGTPDVFKLEYSSKKLNKFRQMALRTITIDYAPDGYWSAYEDSQPIAVVMNLQFTELKPIYDKDQNEEGDNVGY